MEKDERGRGFEFRGGVLCLDFVNTVGWPSSDHSVEHLRVYQDLLAWAEQADSFAPDETTILSARAAREPEQARATLSRAITLREAVRQLFSAAMAGGTPDEAALVVLNQELSRALSRLGVRPAHGSAYRWMWDRDGGGSGLELDCPLWAVAQSAAELLTSPELGNVKTCADEECGWMFLDRSRNSSRRWCDSRDCGNRERVRRHYIRKRTSQS